MSDLIPLNLRETAQAVAACIRAGRVPLVLGPPGVAKSALAKLLAPVVGAALGLDEYPADVCILSNYDAVDVGGLPALTSDGAVERVIFGAFKRAAESARLLVLDEFFATAPSVQGPAARLVLEGIAGEAPLHPQTRIMTIANPPEQTPGGTQPAAMLVNRVVQLRCRPHVEEIAAWFRDPEAADAAIANAARASVVVDAQEYDLRRAALMTEMSFVMEARTDMVCFDPPDASITDGEPFGSPRAWHALAECLAATTFSEGGDTIVQALTNGAVGLQAGTVYLAIRKARAQLPTVAEVIESPDTAKVPGPGERDLLVAAISLITEAATRDTGAAWVYLDRYPDELVSSLCKPMTRLWRKGGGQWDTEGRRVMQAVAAWQSNLARGVKDANGQLPPRPRRDKKTTKAA